MKMQFTFFSGIVMLLLIMITNPSTSGIPIDTNEHYIRIIEIGHFNDDAALDTLIGVAEENLNFKPRFIYWGNDTNSTIPDSLKLDYLEINYPDNWIKEIISSNSDYLNNDTIMDVGLFMSGLFVDPTILVGDSLRDTVLNVIIFGQRGLDTLSSIQISEISSFQVVPYLAMHMRYGHELINPLYRGLRETVSYEFNTVELDIEDTSETPPPIIATNVEYNDSLSSVKFYPNPVHDIASLEINGLAVGAYTFIIYDELASIALKELIQISSSNLYKRQFNLKQLPSGKYYLFIEGNNRKVGPIQFVIIK